MDAGESPETAALRELYEETGYTASVKHVTPGTERFYESPEGT